MIRNNAFSLFLSLLIALAAPHLHASAQVPAAPPSAAIDVDKLPTVAAPAAAFPYIDFPDAVPQGNRRGKDNPFDAIGIIVGNKIRMVEGRIMEIDFSHRQAKLSELLAKRDYDQAIRALGGVKVNAVLPEDEGFKAEHGKISAVRKKLRAIPNASYDAYVINKPGGRAWLILMVDHRETTLIAVDEKNVTSAVKLINADTMKKELDVNGRVALYINFDTDKASIRPDGKPMVDQIAALLKNNPTLKLSIEGHTDDTGKAKRNKALSAERAQAVAAMLKDAGIDQARLSASGHGADKPLAPNTDEAGRAKNRRVELVKVTRN